MAEIIRRKKRKRVELKFRTKMVPVEVAICPKCGEDMEKERNMEALSLYTWKCAKCGYKH